MTFKGNSLKFKTQSFYQTLRGNVSRMYISNNFRDVAIVGYNGKKKGSCFGRISFTLETDCKLITYGTGFVGATDMRKAD